MTEGPSRELDVRIALAVGWDLPRGGVHPFKELAEKFGFTWAVETATDYSSVYRSLPRYTASLDAAMTLIPDEHRAGVLYHAMQRIQQTGFPNSTFLQRLILEIVAAALRAGDTDAG